MADRLLGTVGQRTRKLIQAIAGPLKATPYRITITGQTSGPEHSPQPNNSPWNLSVDRANTVRGILEEEGYPSNNIAKVAAKPTLIRFSQRIHPSQRIAA